MDTLKHLLGKPIPDEFFRVSGRNGEEVAKVRGPVVEQQHSLHRCIRVDNNPLGRLECPDIRLLDGALVGNHRSNRRLDEAGGKGQSNHADDKGRDSVSLVDDAGDGCDHQEDMRKNPARTPYQQAL